MKKKSIIAKIIIFSLFLNAVVPCFSEDTTPLPYSETSTPQGLKDLRRFEIITLGSLPFVTLDVGLVYSGIRWADHDFDPAFSPNPFATSTYEEDEQKKIFFTALGISAGIALTDYVINLIKRSKKKRQAKLSSENAFVTPLSEDADASMIPFDGAASVPKKDDNFDFSFDSESEKDFSNFPNLNEQSDFSDEVWEVEE